MKQEGKTTVRMTSETSGTDKGTSRVMPTTKAKLPGGFLGRTSRETITSVGLLAAPLAAGMFSTAVTGEFASRYDGMPLPPGSPPGWLFPVVWTGLYVLMGIASQRAFVAGEPWRRKFLAFHGGQLLLNVIWSPMFFALGWKWPALAAIVAMLGMVTTMTVTAWKARRRDIALMLMPYMAWLTFATYLNAGSAILG